MQAKPETETDTGYLQSFSISGRLITLFQPSESNSQQAVQAQEESPASPPCFDKIALATSSRRLTLQTLLHSPGNGAEDDRYIHF